MNQELGKWLIGIGVFVIVVGLIYTYFGDKLGWMGNLPGDIRIEGERTKIYFPITTMILLSVLVNLIFRLVHYLK